MQITPAYIARVALAIAAIPLISALIAFVCTFAVVAFIISFIVSWLNEEDHKFRLTLFTGAWTTTKAVISTVLKWVHAPTSFGGVLDWFDTDQRSDY